MNRSKRSLSAQLRKKMSKAIREVQSGAPSIKSRKTSPALTAKQMLKEYPKRTEKQKRTLLATLRQGIDTKKNRAKGALSKRTTPGTVPSDSPPAHPHREGKRWIKVLTKQASAKRTVATHNAGKK